MTITYSGAHAKLRRERGPATGYTCECGKPAREWAYLYDAPDPNELIDPRHGCRYTGDPSYYRAMCHRCHQVYDRSVITHCPQGHEYTEKNTIIDSGKRKCRMCHNARQRRRARPTPEQQARRTELQRVRRARARAERDA